MEFPSTQWTLLAQATLHGDTAAGEALGAFVANYRQPVMALLRRRGLPESRVEDLVQDFFLHLMKSSSLKRADGELGRFRSYLSGALTRFLSDDASHNGAQKRGGGIAPLSLDSGPFSSGLPSPAEADTSLFLDRDWALHLMTRALDKVAADWIQRGKSDRFAVLRTFLPGATEILSQQEAAIRLGLSDVALRAELLRLRESYRSAVRAEVAATVSSPSEVDGEMRHLFAVLQAAPENNLSQPAPVS